MNDRRSWRRFRVIYFLPLLLCVGIGGLTAWPTRAADEPAQAEDERPIAVDDDRELVTVPELRGEKEADARQLATLADARFAAGVYYVAPRFWRDELPADRVLMQTPQPGRRVPRGTPIAVWLPAKAGDERPLVETPDLRTLTARDAAARIKAAGLALLPVAEDADAAAHVVEQYPPAGKKVYQGMAVYFLLDHTARVR